MSREVRRVPLDFNWPLNKVWSGYLTPEKFHETRCQDCYGRGSTPARQWVERIGLMLDQLIRDLDDQAGGKAMHPWLANDPYPPVNRDNVLSRRGWMVEYEVVRPSADIVEFAQELVKDDEYERNRTIKRGPFAQNQYAITNGLLRRAGMPEKWGWCATCNGHGSVEAYEGQRAEAEAWEPTEPPEGDGWQLWETVSEGSPITPVFATREGLVDHLCSPAYRRPLTRDEAEGLVDAGWVPSGIGNSLGFVAGEQSQGKFAAVVLGLTERGDA
ncbi:hypothetical protein [Nocardia farcinica]|uniref:Uncharacterized protein n=1 Tax=Nocardia farcinica (strain IFM 10152) TaxID=247156 RepID=Q5YSK7_NOCFA|nr:hypothetical protein [Nocardia farcinica]BAD58834.1 hypothetical protein NFA_39860 [Nocardia farcinica IFM 10152]